MVEWADRQQDLSSAARPSAELPVLAKASLDFSASADYLNRTKRYVVRVGELPEGGEPLVYPEGTDNAGEAIKAHEDGTPERGVVFWNGKDRVWQTVRGNGKETILITDVNAGQAALLEAKEMELLGDNPSHSLESARELLQYGADVLGLVDRQNKKAAAVENEMEPISGGSPNHQRVTKNVLHKAVFVSSGFIFKDGPVEQTYPEGAVILTDGKHCWGIAKDVFIRNFKRSEDGQEIGLISLKEEFQGTKC
jgi:hypothetical protein